MKKLLLFLCLMSLGVMAAAIEQYSIFSAQKLPLGSAPLPGMANKIVSAPGQHGGQALEITYPQYGKKGAPEWPAVYFRGADIHTVALKDWDALTFTIYNPLPEAVDLGVSINGDKHWQKHIFLQPNAWNHRIIPCSEIMPTVGARVKNFDFFMTRPAKKFKLWLDDVRFIRRNPPEDTPIPAVCTLMDFEGAKLPRACELNDVLCELSRDWAADGKQSVKLTYREYKDGMAPWPSFQFWTAADDQIGYDWSAFSTLSFTTRYNGQGVQSIRVYIADAKGQTSTQDFMLNPGTEGTWTMSLRKLGVDTRCIRQVDWFITRPERTAEIYLDAVRLHTPKASELSTMTADLKTLQDKIAAIPPERRGSLAADCNALANRVKSVLKSAETEVNTLRERRRLAATEQELQDWLSGKSRLLDEESLIAATAKCFPQAPFGIGLADSMTKVMIQDLPLKGVTPAESVSLELAKNEYESFQVVMMGCKEAQASVEVSAVTMEGAEIPAGAFTVSLVGHVKCGKPPYGALYQGWWPDPLLDFQQTAPVKPHEAVAFWVRLKAPEQAKAGSYRGTVTVKANGAAVAVLPLTVRVYDFVVPEKSPLDTAIDFRDHIKQVYGKDMSQEQHDEMFDKYIDKLAEYKIDYDVIYRHVKRGDTKALTQAIATWKRLRDRGLLRCFNIINVNTPRDCTKADDPRVQQEIDRVLAVLDYWVPILKREDLLKYAYIYGYDEYSPSCFPAIAAVFKGIKARYPEIPLATTAYDHSFGMDTCLGDAVDIFTPLTRRYLPEAVAASRKAGHKIWWYICIAPPHPYANWFVEYDAIEARLLMGAMTAKYRPDGFLYYALSRWPVNKQPIDGGPYTNWNPASFNTANGDGSIFCAGPNGMLGTIRAENFRDGLEDYAYVLELEKRLGGKLPAEFQVPTEVVSSLTAFTRDPQLVRQYRRKLAEAIEKAGRNR